MNALKTFSKKYHYKKYSLVIIACGLFVSSALFTHAAVTPYISGEVGGTTNATHPDVEALNTEWKAALPEACEFSVNFLADGVEAADGSYDFTDVTSSGVDMNISARDVNLANQDLGTIRTSFAIANGDDMQDTAPFPTSLSTGGNADYWNDTGGAGSTPNGALFDFGEPIEAFGAWFGDLETRDHPKLTVDGAPAGHEDPTPAHLLLFNSAGVLVQDIIIETDESLVTDTVNFDDCGAGSGGPTKCGNETTRWVGFTADIADDIQYVLVTVGDDDDASDTATSYRSFTERLSFAGPIVADCPEIVDTYDLAIEKTVLDYNQAENSVTFEIIVTNEGSVASGAYEVTDTPPAGFTFVSAAPAACVAGEPTVCNFTEDIDPNGGVASFEVTYTFDPNTLEAGEYQNIAEISDDGSGEDLDDIDSDPTTSIDTDEDEDDDTYDDDEDSVDFVISYAPIYDLALEKSLVSYVDGEATYTIEVINQGTVDVSTYEVTDTPPSDFTFLNSTESSCVDMGGITICPITAQPLIVGASYNFDVVYAANDLTPGEYVNTAAITADDSGEDLDDIDSDPAVGGGEDDLEDDLKDDDEDVALLVIDEPGNPGGDDDDDKKTRSTRRPPVITTNSIAPVYSLTAYTPFPQALERCDCGPSVERMQSWLNANGFVLRPYGNGSMGSETECYGLYSEKAVARFQMTYADYFMDNNLGFILGAFDMSTQNLVHDLEAGTMIGRPALPLYLINHNPEVNPDHDTRYVQ